jgi:hypothetical protein
MCHHHLVARPDQMGDIAHGFKSVVELFPYSAFLPRLDNSITAKSSHYKAQMPTLQKL